MRIAIYSRKSKFTEKGDSVENQIEMCRQHINFHYPNTQESDICIFEDEGYSGKNLDRPQFSEMMRQQAQKPFDAIMVYRLDRISRSVADFSAFIVMLQKDGTDFVSIKENFDTNTSTGRVMMNMSAVFSQFERESIAERIKDNMYLMAKDGRWTGGTTPLGYVSEKVEYEAGGKKRCYYKLVVNEAEAAIVQLIYSKFLKEQSCKAVEVHLVNNGFRTRKGVLFDDVAVRRILTNPVYCAVDDNSIEYFSQKGCKLFTDNTYTEPVGFMPYNRTNQTRKLQSMEKWLISVGQHSPLVNSADWIRVQRILQYNSEQFSQYTYKTHSENRPVSLLTGVIRCSCGAPMIVKRYETNGDNFSYICSAKQRSRGKLCKEKNCIGKKADKIIRDLILSSDTDENIIFEHIKRLKKSADTVENYNESLSHNLLRTIADKEKQAENLISSIASGTINGAALEQINNTLNNVLAELDTLKNNLGNLTVEKPHKQSSLNDISAALSYLKEHFDDIPLMKRRTLIRRVIKKIVWNGENLDIYLVGAEETNESSENIKLISDKPPEPMPEKTDYQQFRERSDKVVKAYIKAKNITLKQLADICNVSYTTTKYWARKRNSPSEELYESFFKEFFTTEYC